MILFLHGNSSLLIERRRRALALGFSKKYPEGEMRLFDFEDQGEVADVREALGAGAEGLFSSRKLIIILHPFALREGGSDTLLNFLETYAEKASDEATFLFVETSSFRKNDKRVKALEKVAEKVEILDAPTGKGLETWVQKELSSFDPAARITREALDDLIHATKGELPRLASEIEKLSIFCEGREITREDVECLVEFSREDVIFQALDALSRGNTSQALLLFRAEEAKPEGAYPLLSMCAWQTRRLLLVRECFDRGTRNASEVAVYADLRPFAAEKALQGITRFSLERLKKSLMLLAEFDVSIKRGALDPSVALNLFIWRF